MFWRKQTTLPAIPARYYQIALNMHGRHYSYDVIRQALIQRGLAWEDAFRLVEEIDQLASAEDARLSAHRLRPLMGFAPHWYF